jgi:hypothetical protein
MVVLEADGPRQGSVARLLDVAGRELDGGWIINGEGRAADITLEDLHIRRLNEVGCVIAVSSK